MLSDDRVCPRWTNYLGVLQAKQLEGHVFQADAEQVLIERVTFYTVVYRKQFFVTIDVFSS